MESSNDSSKPKIVFLMTHMQREESQHSSYLPRSFRPEESPYKRRRMESSYDSSQPNDLEGFCDPCNGNISKPNWARHVKTKNHQF